MQRQRAITSPTPSASAGTVEPWPGRGWDRSVLAEDYRASALILFLLLLDLLTPPRTTPPGPSRSSYARLLSALRSRPPYASIGTGALWPTLVGDSGVPWAQFAKLAFAYALDKANSELAPTTRLALQRWAR